MATGNAINANNSGIQGYDAAGTWNASAVTQYQVQIGGANNHTLAGITVGTNGQVLVGSSAAAPVFATLTGSGGITFTTGAGTLQINSTGGGISWSVVTVNASFVGNTGTIANKGSTLTMTLPASSSIGDVISITGINTALGWSIAQNANQQIFFGTSSTTVGVAGSISSINIRDSLTMVCVVAGASAVWNVIDAVGNMTIV